MDDLYDIAIVGSGPAGVSAAVNAKIRNKKIILFGNNDLSSKLNLAPKIDNYLGYYNVTGRELTDKFIEHLNSMNIEISKERINNIYAMGDYFSLMVNDKEYKATTVILATGVLFGKPFKGEVEFLGRGVGYCATCDAPLYKGRPVAIIGYNKEAEEEANYVSELASIVYYIPTYKGEYELKENIEIIKDKPLEIVGDLQVKKLLLANGEIEVDGVFILRDNVAPEQLVPGLEVDENHIKVNRDMKTNIQGCYAAGDVVGKPYQYMKAMGEGQVAALNAVRYLDNLATNK